MFEEKVIIGICGRAGAGKSTLAELLGARLPFAAPLKNMLLSLGLSREQVYGDQKEVPCELLGGRTPRYAMQTLGTEWGRVWMGDDFWVRQWQRVALAAPTPIIVCDDVRFESEVEAIRSLGGYLLAVERGSSLIDNPGHASEQLDYAALNISVLQNNKSVAELYFEAVELLQSMGADI